MKYTRMDESHESAPVLQLTTVISKDVLDPLRFAAVGECDDQMITASKN